MKSRPPPDGNLKLVFHLKEPVISEEGIEYAIQPDGSDAGLTLFSIVIIPAAFSHYGANERREACSWLKPLVVATANDTRVLYFAYDLDVDAGSIWRQLINHGLTLINCLKKLHHDTNVGEGISDRFIRKH